MYVCNIKQVESLSTKGYNMNLLLFSLNFINKVYLCYIKNGVDHLRPKLKRHEIFLQK